jgi:hypothetical protein
MFNSSYHIPFFGIKNNNEYELSSDDYLFNEYLKIILNHFEKSPIMFLLIVKYTTIKKYIPSLLVKHIIQNYILNGMLTIELKK